MSEEEENPIEEWISKTEEAIKVLKERKPKDRLDLVAAIEEAVISINASTVGWNSWTKNSQVMKQFTEEELQAIWEKLQSFGCEFLEFDIKWTKNLANKKPKRSEIGKERANYIS